MVATYQRPIVSVGKTDEITLNNNPSATDVLLELDNSGGEFVVGDPVFISEDDDTEIQYLNKVVVATAADITMEYPVAVNKEASPLPKIWKPTSFVAFEFGPGSNMRFPIDTGVVVSRTRSGNIIRTKIADTTRQILMNFQIGKPQDFRSYEQFLINSRNGGVSSFSLGFWDHNRQESRVVEVTAILPGLQDSIFNKVLASFSLAFYELNDQVYVET